MSEYKENTVGWWLSQLKEPLKSRALGIVMDTSHPCDNLDGALTSVLNCLIEGSIMWTYWQGVYVYYFGGLHIDSTNFKDGFDIAHECDPWREDKAIVDSHAPEIPATGAMIEDFGKRVKWPITREIEAPERAVVGYEEPKPIDTIEKKHELRIKNLEARVKYLDDMTASLLRFVEIITKQLPKKE